MLKTDTQEALMTALNMCVNRLKDLRDNIGVTAASPLVLSEAEKALNAAIRERHEFCSKEAVRIRMAKGHTPNAKIVAWKAGKERDDAQH